MDIWGKAKSPFGYQTNHNGIDSYGVDHSNFSLRDEIAYQMARENQEQRLTQHYNNQGITSSYPQFGTDFWGNTPENNYGFGSSNIESNVDTVVSRLSNNDRLSNRQVQQEAWQQHKMRNVENDLLMDGLDTMYGMNRTINGMTFGGLDWLGNKLGFDSQMNEYLNLKNEQDRNLAKLAGNVAEFGGAALTGGSLAKAGYNQANMLYNGYKIGKNYDKLLDNPYQGNGSDIIARMKNHNGEPVILQRGEALCGENGEVITSGKALKKITGTERNYGLNKAIYKHDMTRQQVQQIPKYIRRLPAEVSQYNQDIYITKTPAGEIKVVSTPKNGVKIISSMYKIDR